MHTCIYDGRHADNVCMCMHTNTYTHTYPCMSVFILPCRLMCVPTYSYMYMLMHGCLHTYIYAHMFMHAY